MNRYFFQTAIFLLLFVIYACFKPSNETPRFSSDQDTLIIVTQLHKGYGKFERIFGPLRFQDISELSYPIKLPTNLTEIKHTVRRVNYEAEWYRKIKNNVDVELPPEIIAAISDNTLDTTQLPSEEQNRIDIITGIQDSVKVFVLDENNNQDLTDDSVRVYQPMNWNSNENLIKSVFHRYDGERIVKDSTWVKVGTLGSNPMLFYGVAEYVTADFYLDDQFYQLGSADFQASYTYWEPKFALLTDNFVVKDSIHLGDILYPNEFVRLKNDYYRIAKVSKYGEHITLIKEHNFSAQTGSQVGIQAHDFTAVSTTGDTIFRANMHDAPLLIANSCGCGGDMRSLEAYDQMARTYGNQAYIINIDTGERGLDTEEDTYEGGIYIDMEDENNEELYNHFRGTYCSRICYIIDTNNTVVSKFSVIDWKDEVPKFLDADKGQ